MRFHCVDNLVSSKGGVSSCLSKATSSRRRLVGKQPPPPSFSEFFSTVFPNNKQTVCDKKSTNCPTTIFLDMEIPESKWVCIDDKCFDESIPYGCAINPRNNVSPFPAACNKWPSHLQWKRSDLCVEQIEVEKALAVSYWDLVNKGGYYLSIFMVPWMPPLLDVTNSYLRAVSLLAVEESPSGRVSYEALSKAHKLIIYTDGSGLTDAHSCATGPFAC